VIAVIGIWVGHVKQTFVVNSGYYCVLL